MTVQNRNGLVGPLVVDVNVLAYHVLQMDPRLSPLASQLAKRAPTWILPSIWKHEFVNILATSVRTGRLTPEESARFYGATRAIFEPVESDVDLGWALDEANERQLSGYDAQYVVLALERQAFLVTEDKKLIRNAPSNMALTLEQALKLIR